MSRPLHILSVYGTRPEVIKLAPVISCLRNTDDIQVTVLATGQHRDLAPMAEQSFGISPDISLDVMHEGQSLPQLYARAAGQLSDCFSDTSPDMVLVQGDTTTSLAAAQAAFFCKVKVGHIEAGIRSHNRYAPFPEEMNRRIITSLATLHMAPTDDAAQNLAAAGVPDEDIFVTGNTVIDALAQTANHKDVDDVRSRLHIPEESPLILATVHRRESWGERMTGIAAALLDILDFHVEYCLAIPLHPNPVVRDALREALQDHPRVYLFDALPYTDFVGLLKSCHIVLSDSGGVQEEAPFFNKPVVVMRNETDRPEAVANGTAVLATTDRGRIVEATSEILNSPETYRRMAEAPNPYGDGRASQRIAQAILSHFGRGEPPEPFLCE
jgi:UDP-N-acetylglucosamine 2-epimerase (non-hydrolysing)